MSADYVFRRQCMACLGELCPLLPLPEIREKPPSTTSTNGGKKSRRPKHLQAICDFIYALGEYQSKPSTVTVATGPVELISTNLTSQLSTAYRQFHSLFARVESTNDNLSTIRSHTSVEIQELEIRWLEALNGSLDAYNWLIKCLEATPASALFLPSPPPSQEESQSDQKGMKRKRQQSESSTPHTRELLPLGQILMTNILFFLRLCCIRLLNLQYEGPQLHSYPPSHLLGRSKQQLYHEKLLLEVYRRILQLLTALLDTDSTYFLNYFQTQGILVRTGGGSSRTAISAENSDREFSPEIQFLLLCGLGVVDIAEITNNYHNTSRQRNIIQTLESIADHIAREFASLLPQKNFIYHFSRLPQLLSFSDILNEKISQGRTEGSRGGGSDFQSEEYVTNIPITIEQLLLHLSRTNLSHLLTSSLWSNVLTYNLESLTPTSLLSSVLAMKRCMAILKRCNLLSLPFGTNFQSVLRALGLSLIQTTLRSSDKRPLTTGAVGGGAAGAGRSNQLCSLTPTAIEVGSALLSLSVDFDVPLATFAPASSSSPPASLIEIILTLPHSSGSTNSYSGEIFLQYYGSTIVDILIGIEGNEKKFLENCQLFLNLMRATAASLSSTDRRDLVLLRCSLLLSKICTGIVERANTMRPDALAQFVFLFGEQIYQESLQYPTASSSSSSLCTASTSSKTKLFCTRENIGLILHLESLLPATLREEGERGGGDGVVMKKIRQFVLENILCVFNRCGDSAVKEGVALSPLFEGDLCESIVKSFQLLPYLIPGTTAICPRLCSPGAVNGQEDEKKIQNDVSASSFSPFLIFHSSPQRWKRLLQQNSH
jgi:hypothetical protein